MSSKKLTVDAGLEKLQRETFGYFLHETNPANGLVIDRTAADWPARIAATGLSITWHAAYRTDHCLISIKHRPAARRMIAYGQC